MHWVGLLMPFSFFTYQKINKLIKAKKKDFIDNTLEEEGTQAFTFGTDGDKGTREREVICLSRSLISKLVRLQWKNKFQGL